MLQTQPRYEVEPNPETIYFLHLLPESIIEDEDELFNKSISIQPKRTGGGGPVNNPTPAPVNHSISFASTPTETIVTPSSTSVPSVNNANAAPAIPMTKSPSAGSIKRSPSSGSLKSSRSRDNLPSKGVLSKTQTPIDIPSSPSSPIPSASSSVPNPVEDEAPWVPSSPIEGPRCNEFQNQIDMILCQNQKNFTDSFKNLSENTSNPELKTVVTEMENIFNSNYSDIKNLVELLTTNLITAQLEIFELRKEINLKEQTFKKPSRARLSQGRSRGFPRNNSSLAGSNSILSSSENQNNEVSSTTEEVPKEISVKKIPEELPREIPVKKIPSEPLVLATSPSQERVSTGELTGSDSGETISPTPPQKPALTRSKSNPKTGSSSVANHVAGIATYAGSSSHPLPTPPVTSPAPIHSSPLPSTPIKRPEPAPGGSPVPHPKPQRANTIGSGTSPLSRTHGSSMQNASFIRAPPSVFNPVPGTNSPVNPQGSSFIHAPPSVFNPVPGTNSPIPVNHPNPSLTSSAGSPQNSSLASSAGASLQNIQQNPPNSPVPRATSPIQWPPQKPQTPVKTKAELFSQFTLQSKLLDFLLRYLSLNPAMPPYPREAISRVRGLTIEQYITHVQAGQNFGFSVEVQNILQNFLDSTKK